MIMMILIECEDSIRSYLSIYIYIYINIYVTNTVHVDIKWNICDFNLYHCHLSELIPDYTGNSPL